ncbi:MAG: phenylalanine--tRNA ligase subunit beta [Flavobacteriales bacterium]
MKVSLDWLKDFADITLPREEIASILTDTGLEVEKVETVDLIKGGLKGVVVGEVLEKRQHPNADRLSITKVNIGESKALQIVCGAPNVAEGQKVMVSTIGAELHPISGDPFKIKKGKIRGEVSEGMICAEDELGLGKGHDGIMVLDSQTIPGTPAAEHLGLSSDTCIEIGLTPNRTDALGHLGVARDLLVGLKHSSTESKKGLELKPLEFSHHPIRDNKTFKIAIENPEDCEKYLGAVIKGVTVKESSELIKRRLKTIGIEPINNIVDITNYVLHELGHPLHAFDLDVIGANEVKVMKAKEGVKFTTLDGKERILDKNDITIADANSKPLCLAGVFGGIDSGVSVKTTNIFLECAVFDAISVRKTAKRHQLNTDASFRFERGVDPDMCKPAISRAIDLILEHAGGALEQGVIDTTSKTREKCKIDFSPVRCQKMIGLDIPFSKMENILTDLDFEIEKTEGDTKWICYAPKYRVDVTREADVIEEILRIYGYNNIPLPEKLNSSLSYFNQNNSERIRTGVADMLSSQGFNEIMNNSLTAEEHSSVCSSEVFGDAVKLLNPLSKDLAELRTNLAYNMLQAASFNMNRKSSNLMFYEFGNVYAKAESGYKEKHILGLMKSGLTQKEGWLNGKVKTEMVHLVQSIESVLQNINVPYSISQTGNYLEIKSKKVIIGSARKATSKELKHFNIKQEVFLCFLDWTAIHKVNTPAIKYSSVSKFPEVQRDLSLLLDEQIKYEELEALANQLGGKILKGVSLFDVYEGDKLPKGKKSYALRYTLGDHSKTLEDKTIEKTMERILNGYKKQFQAELR